MLLLQTRLKEIKIETLVQPYSVFTEGLVTPTLRSE